MADSTVEAAKSAERAYAEATAEAKPAKATETEPKGAEPAHSGKAVAETPTPAVTKTQPAQTTKKTAPKRPTSTAKAKAAKRAARVAKAAAAPAPVKNFEPKPTVTELKEKIMAAAKNTSFTQPMADTFGEIQTRAKVAYEKSTEVVTEMTDFAKGNVEAFVESSKIFSAGAQSLGKTYVEEAKSAYETMTADVKELASVKSPTELFQLQGKIMRRNFDALVSTGSKNTEAVLKLANDTFAPLSGRVNVAAEKLTKVA